MRDPLTRDPATTGPEGRVDEDRFDEVEEGIVEEAVEPLGPEADEATPGRIGRTPDAMPDTPNEDMGNLASPNPDVEMQRTSDDNDLNPEGSGVEDTHLRTPYESMARRDDIARRVDELLVEIREWADEDGSEEALDILETVEDLSERLGEPPEDSDT